MTSTFPPIDTLHHYLDRHGSQAYCRLRIFRQPDRPVVVVVTELEDNPGTGITTVADRLAWEVCARYAIHPETLLWIEHHGPWKTLNLPERYRTVEFASDATGRFCQPHRRPIDKARVTRLAGWPLD